MAGPFIVVVAGISTAWIAVSSNDGLVSDDYYKQGLAVNQQLHRDHQAEKMALQADVMRADKSVRVLLTADDPAKLPVEIRLKLAHPTRAGFDQLLTLNNEGAGFYSGKLSDEISGRWLISIEDASGEWRLQGEWLADSDKPLRLNAKKD